MVKYKDWQLFETIPDGWIIDKTAGSPMPYTVFITNGKSVLNGQKRALLKIAKKQTVIETYENIQIFDAVDEIKPTNEAPFPSKTVNTLARKRFQEQLLKDIRCDLIICELEGWDKKEYIRELKEILNSFDVSEKTK